MSGSGECLQPKIWVLSGMHQHFTAKHGCVQHSLQWWSLTVAAITSTTLCRNRQKPPDLTSNTAMLLSSHRQMEATYGHQWLTPTMDFHGNSATTPDEPLLRKALLDKLSVTAWGNVPYHQQLEQCSKPAKRSSRERVSQARLAHRYHDRDG